MDKILIALIKQNENLLIRRDELIGKLDEEVPPKLRRDYAAIRQAIELNVSEIFSAKRFDLQAAKSEAEKILHESGMQEARVNFVLETFEKVIPAVFPAQIVEEPTQTIKTSPAKNVEPNKNSAASETIKPVKAVEKIFSTAQTIFNKKSAPTPTPPVQNTPPPPTSTISTTSTVNDTPAQVSTSEDVKLKNLMLVVGVLLVLGFFWHYSFSFGWFAFGIILGFGGLAYLFTTSPMSGLAISIGVILAFFFATGPTTLSLVCGILAGLVNMIMIGITLG